MIVRSKYKSGIILRTKKDGWHFKTGKIRLQNLRSSDPAKCCWNSFYPVFNGVQGTEKQCTEYKIKSLADSTCKASKVMDFVISCRSPCGLCCPG